MKDKFFYTPNERRLAWAVYKYFIANPQLKKEEKGKKIFEMARRTMLDIYCDELEDGDEEIVETAIIMVAKWQNKKSFEIDLDTPLRLD